MNDDEQDWAAVSPFGFRVTLDEKSKVGSSQVKSTLLGPEVRILRGVFRFSVKWSGSALR